MKPSLLIVLTSVLSVLPNEAKSQRSSKTAKLTATKAPPYPTSPKFVNYYVSTKLGIELTRLIDSELSKLSINFYYGNNNNVKLSESINKPTTVFLKKTVAKNTNELLFFIGYALGLVPEITRKSSRVYVKVWKENILESDFERYYKEKMYDSKTIASTSFDHSSKMLSSPYFRSRNKQKTYTFLSDLSQYYEENINRTEFFSYNDIKRLWYLYCRDKCGKKNDCKNSAYFKNGCNQCQCPKPFAGDKCQHILNNDESCGRTQIYFISSFREIHEKNNIQSFCSYVVKGENGKKVRFEILNLTLSREDACKNGFGLEVKYRNDKGAAGLFLCRNLTNISFPALSNEVYFTFSDIGKNMLEFRIQEV
uniref:Astacin domain-containing protein n=1 Tax=Strongyloides papillosus TaxID=174720 RepID=A0A0N5BS80_STREA